MAPPPCRRHVAHRPCGRCLLVSVSAILALVACAFFFAGPRPWSIWPSVSTAASRQSPFSFDIAASLHADWMAGSPDDLSLAHLSLPGTHDTLTHRVHNEVYQCQNSDLATQLRAGVRYLDIRARVQVPPEAVEEQTGQEQHPPWPLGIYHGSAYTGYEFAYVAATVFQFLDANPSETIVLRLKEEAAPIVGSVDDPPGRRPDDASIRPDWQQNIAVGPQSGQAAGLSPFEASFAQYRLHDARTAAGFAEHLYRFPTDDVSSPPTHVPTMGELRGKVLVLQEFPYFSHLDSDAPNLNITTYFGIPWQLSSELLQVEDFWQVEDMAHLGKKWTAIEENLQAAGKAAEDVSTPMPLFLSHLSASIGVTPIDAAAGSVDHSVVGMNDRTGEWAAAGQALSPMGIVIADFPGRQLIEAVLRRNNFTRTV